MYRPITNWSTLQKQLRARSEQIERCLDCGHLWIVNVKNKPRSCPQCRTFENVPRRSGPGRPRKAVNN